MLVASTINGGINMKESLNPDTILAPIPAVMVSCGNMQNSNIITIAWTGIINSIPPMAYISIRPTRYSYNIIKKTIYQMKV